MRYFTGFLIAIGLIVLLFVVILKSGGNSGNAPQKQINLATYASSDAIAQLTIDGPINADQTHTQVQISVSQAETTFQILTGYQGTIQTSKTFQNNQNSYSAFLQALDVAGFTKGSSVNIPDKQGYCPTGDRYTFELMQTGSDIENYWSTSCGGQGTYKGNTLDTLSLFEAQVPNYDDLTGSLQL
jgi:hypothetical protein